MVEVVWGRLLPGRRRRRQARDRSRLFGHIVIALRWATALAVLALLGWGIAAEIRTSFLQSRIFSALARNMTFSVEPGASDTILFPKGGPYDQRLGYAELPRFIDALGQRRFRVGGQARWSPALERFVKNGGYAIYHEKSRAGLELFDRDGAPLYRARYPARTYRDFASIPPLVVDSLLFIEDRDLLAANDPERNPAVDWDRFALAARRPRRRPGRSAVAPGRGQHAGDPDRQIPPFPTGPHAGCREKLRQMVTAAIHAYRHGPDTIVARRRIITAYLNSEPLGSRKGYGEIIGLPEALWRWYGTDLGAARRVLTAPAATPAELARKGEIYRQVLSLLLAGRRPAYYLTTDHRALAALTDRYLYVAERSRDHRSCSARRGSRRLARLYRRTGSVRGARPMSPTRQATSCATSSSRSSISQIIMRSTASTSAAGRASTRAPNGASALCCRSSATLVMTDSLGLYGRQLLGERQPGAARLERRALRARRRRQLCANSRRQPEPAVRHQCRAPSCCWARRRSCAP